MIADTGFIALIHAPASSGSFGVTFPDVPGCASGGASFEQAVRMAGEALSGHLAMLQAGGDVMPAARTFAEISADLTIAEDLEGAVPQLIVPRIVQAEKVRVNISIDRAVLRHADAYADAHGLTRSGLIERSLESATRR
jgi:predicted RNase H-like HicB family nuclease